MRLFEATNGKVGESYVRKYVWAEDHVHAGKLAGDGWRLTLLFDTSFPEFVTAESDDGFGAIGIDSAITDKPAILRGSGRTTRMLAEARLQAINGRPVYILTADSDSARLLQKKLDDDGENLRIKAICVDNASASAIDWKKMTLRGFSPNCILLADHSALESLFSGMLSMLHRYDDQNRVP